MQKQMLAHILVGHHNPWLHRDFQAFKAGFNCIEGRPLIKACVQIPLKLFSASSLIHKMSGDCRYLQRFLSTVYSRRIEQPADVIPYIRWQAVGAARAGRLSAALFSLFIMRFIRWMSGIGHPGLMLEDGHITEQVYERDQSDPGLRARLFYRTVSGSSLRLIGYAKENIYVCDKWYRCQQQ